VPDANMKIEHLEGSIATLQDVLDNTQRVLALADETGKRAGEVARDMRRTLIVVGIAGAALITLATLRRQATAGPEL
jgi:hypothetical protein